MRNRTRVKLAGLLLCGGMLLQFSGCLNQAYVGFARAFGAVPAGFASDYLFGDTLDTTDLIYSVAAGNLSD